MTNENTSDEELVLDTNTAKELAKHFKPREGGGTPPDPLPDIPHSLLSAEHIRDYVIKTGLIAPFYVSGGRKSRLKKAAYEGRIGDSAYIYKNSSEPQRIFAPDSDSLVVPANSIVFVECDLEFRLPEFIALRFNLQIQHVHRGLLLGTGPLVDPGYWGKLCIPLHNLTDKDYEIPKDEGLIWLEFTKTTSSLEHRKAPIGRPPLGVGEGFWDICAFLEKAAKQYGGGNQIPIQSSLPTMFADATDQAEQAARNAQIASEASNKAADETTEARRAANDAVEQAKQSNAIFTGFSVVAVIGVAIGLIALWTAFVSEIRAQNRVFEPRLTATETAINGHLQGLNAYSESSNEFQQNLDRLSDDHERLGSSLDSAIEELERQVQTLTEEAVAQKEENARLRSDIEALQSSIASTPPPQ